MRAVILAGGAGRRLYPYTATLPKPLVPMGDRPILEINLLQLERAGFERATLATGHMAELVMAFFGSGEKYGLTIDYTIEPAPLGTVGPLRLLGAVDETLLVMNGDLLTDLSHRELMAHHRREGAALTLATYTKPVRLALGVVEPDASGRVRGFQEKPELSFTVSMGVYAIEPRVLERIPLERPMGFDELILELLREGERVATYAHHGIWFDIGSPEDYARAIECFEADPSQFLPAPRAATSQPQ